MKKLPFFLLVFALFLLTSCAENKTSAPPSPPQKTEEVAFSNGIAFTGRTFEQIDAEWPYGVLISSTAALSALPPRYDEMLTTLTADFGEDFFLEYDLLIADFVHSVSEEDIHIKSAYLENGLLELTIAGRRAETFVDMTLSRTTFLFKVDKGLKIDAVKPVGMNELIEFDFTFGYNPKSYEVTKLSPEGGK